MSNGQFSMEDKYLQNNQWTMFNQQWSIFKEGHLFNDH